MSRTAFSFIPSSLLLLSSAFAQTDPATVSRIIDQGKDHSQAMNILTGLTNIGSRLTSSTRLEKAEKWAMGQFNKFGCKTCTSKLGARSQ